MAARGTSNPLSARAETVYRQLLTGELESCPSDVEDELARAGLLTDVDEKSVIFPEEALGQLLRQRLPDQLRESAELLTVAARLTALARDRAPVDFGSVAIEFLPESSQRRQAQRMLISTATSDLLVVDGEFAPGFVFAPNTASRVPQRPGEMRWRELIASSSLSDDDIRSAVVELHREMGAELRAHPSIPLWASVADDQLAIISTGPYPRSGALLIRESAMVAMVRTWAEHLWNEAVDVADPTPTGHGLIDQNAQKLLDLMTAGLTDQALASSLGISPRTIRRRIERLSELLGATNRHQLLLLARDHGWEPGPGARIARTRSGT